MGSTKFKKTSEGYGFWCEGCKLPHFIAVDIPNEVTNAQWDVSWNLGEPTAKPSILVTFPWGDPPVNNVCHSYITEGKIEYLTDCTHHLAGQTIELPNFKWSEENDI